VNVSIERIRSSSLRVLRAKGEDGAEGYDFERMPTEHLPPLPGIKAKESDLALVEVRCLESAAGLRAALHCLRMSISELEHRLGDFESGNG
jgi:hypothetical protein